MPKYFGRLANRLTNKIGFAPLASLKRALAQNNEARAIQLLQTYGVAKFFTNNIDNLNLFIIDVIKKRHWYFLSNLLMIPGTLFCFINRYVKPNKLNNIYTSLYSSIVFNIQEYLYQYIDIQGSTISNTENNNNKIIVHFLYSFFNQNDCHKSIFLDSYVDTKFANTINLNVNWVYCKLNCIMALFVLDKNKFTTSKIIEFLLDQIVGYIERYNQIILERNRENSINIIKTLLVNNDEYDTKMIALFQDIKPEYEDQLIDAINIYNRILQRYTDADATNILNINNISIDESFSSHTFKSRLAILINKPKHSIESKRRAIQRFLRLGGNINFREEITGYTALHYAVMNQNKDGIRLLIELGADKTIRDNYNKSAEFYAKNEEIYKLVPIPGKQYSYKPYQGITKKHVKEFNLFIQKNHNNFFEARENISMCPICLTVVHRTVGCNHMQHNCRLANPHGYHEDLYDIFADDQGDIHWCSICSRICEKSDHYKLSTASEALKNNISTVNNPSSYGDCSWFGGGSFEEKFLRINAFRITSLDLMQKKVAKRFAINMLIEAVFEAPLYPDKYKFISNNVWNAMTEQFSNNIMPNNTEDERPVPSKTVKYSTVVRGACDTAETPIEVVNSGVDPISWDPFSDELQGYRFTHMEEEYNVRTDTFTKIDLKRHDDNYCYTLGSIERHLGVMISTFKTNTKFGYCISPEHCRARLFPADLEPLLEYGLNRKLFERYTQLFNWKFGGDRLQLGGVVPVPPAAPSNNTRRIAAGAGLLPGTSAANPTVIIRNPFSAAAAGAANIINSGAGTGLLPGTTAANATAYTNNPLQRRNRLKTRRQPTPSSK